ncbi:hypothetical protein [Sinorhizobium americanum]|uniref:Uncharacterized protein n=1 Tax=Sinorhizobium americanum TaxID=194963 RepID=A0A1L3LLV3_9HYPH|nr:hypothetical protein [Sinorhizobium americanum]APG91057.1 hypothetical protein SAMCFNEI73_Ch1765 [Sinorhizobium americanum]OAP43651.1 hypothetical protein ATC00_02010 [Sinorhizobium americanum]
MVAEPGSYRSPTGPNGEYETFDECAARRQSEAAARKREAGLEQRLAALEVHVADVVEASRRLFTKARESTDARIAELTEATELGIGDLRGEVDELFRDAQSDFSDFLKDARAMLRQLQSEASERRTQLAAVKRDYERLALEVEKLRQELADERGKGLRAVR